MQRRKLLAAMGSIVAGGAAATGTGAFASQSERQADIKAVNDSKALIALTDETDGNIVGTSDGELSIDFSAGDASGINTNSQYQLGVLPPEAPGSSEAVLERADTVPEAQDDPAFYIQNQTTQPKQISVQLTTDSLPEGQLIVGLSTDRQNSGSGFAPNSDVVGIGIVNPNGDGGSQDDTANVDDVTGTVGVAAGGKVGAALGVSALDVENDGADLSTTLRIEAEDT